MKFDLENDKLFFLLILADLSFIFLHILHTNSSLLPNNLFSIDKDRGYAEIFQYIKEFWVAILFFLLGIKKRKLLYIVFSLLFLFLFIDDSFELHERFGAFLADLFHFQPMLGLRARDFGELVVSAFFGTLFFLSIGIIHYQSDNFTRTVSKYILGLIVLLVTFGIMIDMLEIIVEHPLVNPVLVIVEEGGEMIVMSTITWFVFRLNLNSAHDEIPFLWKNSLAADKD